MGERGHGLDMVTDKGWPLAHGTSRDIFGLISKFAFQSYASCRVRKKLSDNIKKTVDTMIFKIQETISL